MSIEEQTGGFTFLLKKGNFTQVANEMLEILAKMQLTPTEYKICFFLIRELVGWDYNFKPVEIEAFMNGTNSSERSVQDALKRLVAEKILLKHKVAKYRTPCYGFNPERFGRVNITEPRGIYLDGENVIDLKTFKILKLRESAPLNSQGPQFEDAKIRTQKTQEAATRAASQTPKYPQTHTNTHKEGGSKVDKNNWESVRAHLITQFPQDEKRLDGTYKQIKERGYEQQDRKPFHPINLAAFIFSCWDRLRSEYSHHDGWKKAE